MRFRKHQDQFQYLCRAQTGSISITPPQKVAKHTVAFDINLEFGAFIVESGEVVVVELRP